MKYERQALNDLQLWSEDKRRKPLILRGARQVGKSTLVRMFGERFDHFIDLNLEKPADASHFRKYADVNDLMTFLSLREAIISKDAKVLLFIDEIQEEPKAIRLLRYFYEERPDIYVIAAGSLLEFALSRVSSFPVGRVQYYYLNPLSFKEFLIWTGYKHLVSPYEEVPLKETGFSLLIDEYHRFAMIGGMPEAVATYAETGEMNRLPIIYRDIWNTYLDDVAKYTTGDLKREVTRHLISSAPFQMDRVKFAGFGDSEYRSREVKEGMLNLDLARVVKIIRPTTSVDIPAIPDSRKRPRLQIIDTAILNTTLGLLADMVRVEDLGNLYRGRIIQHLVTQELITLHTREDYRPLFWVRESNQANSEVDLVYQHGKYLLPVELKSGPQGRLRSLHQFMDRTNHPYAIRFLRNDFSVERYTTLAGTPYFLMNLPYFLMGQIREYADYFVNNYKLEEEEE
jgi:predicted AAA+ superfamily ATPase